MTRSAPFDGITIVSTLTTDVMPNPGGPPREMPGGPAHYTASALTRLRCPWRLISGDQARVEVIPGQDGEEYVIPILAPIVLPGRLEGRATIISPIGGEVATAPLPDADGLVAVDLQGFVRIPGESTRTRRSNVDLIDLFTHADIVKASAEELEALSSESAEFLATKLLLVTHGVKGAEVRTPTGTTFVCAHRVQVSHTIGAGDILLACFVYLTISGREPFSAASEAARFTETVLSERHG